MLNQYSIVSGFKPMHTLLRFKMYFIIKHNKIIFNYKQGTLYVFCAFVISSCTYNVHDMENDLLD